MRLWDFEQEVAEEAEGIMPGSGFEQEVAEEAEGIMPGSGFEQEVTEEAEGIMPGSGFEQRSERREPQRTKRATGCRTRQQWSVAEWQRSRGSREGYMSLFSEYFALLSLFPPVQNIFER